MYPARWFYRKHEESPTTEVAIRRSLAEDLYIVLPGYDLGSQAVTLQIVVNPLVDWIWLGFGVLALGTGIALMPERAYSFAMATLPAEGAATATMAVVLVLLLGAPAKVSAQHGMGTTDSQIQASYFPRSGLERQIQHELVCTCGACGHATIAECRKDACSVSHTMRGELAALIDQGTSHDQIIHWFVSHYGSEEMLGAPIDKGFNRLAWLFPYLMGASGAVGVGFAAMKWSRRPLTVTDTSVPTDPELEERLDDELRNLD